MSPTRTEFHLEPRQRERLDEITQARNQSFAAAVRGAVDVNIEQAPVDPTIALNSTFGAAPEATVPGRGDWAARAVRLKAGGPLPYSGSR